MITLIGKKLAKPGQEFIHYGIGDSKECMGCKLRKVCDNLEVGRRYVVKSSMNKPHEECKVHEQGVMLVEVEPADIDALIPADQAKEGTTIRFITPDCSKYLCEDRHLCSPEGIRDGDECRILKVKEKNHKCLLERELALVTLKVEGLEES